MNKTARMYHFARLALITALPLAACTHQRGATTDHIARLRTQMPAAVMVRCLTQASGRTVAQNGAATVIDAADAQPPRRFTVTEKDGETIVLVEGPLVVNGSLCNTLPGPQGV